MIGKPKSQVTKANGRHPQEIAKVTPPKLINRRNTDPINIEATKLNRTLFYIMCICLAVGCIAGALVFYIFGL